MSKSPQMNINIEFVQKVLGNMLHTSREKDNDLSDPDIINEFVTNFSWSVYSTLILCLVQHIPWGHAFWHTLYCQFRCDWTMQTKQVLCNTKHENTLLMYRGKSIGYSQGRDFPSLSQVKKGILMQYKYLHMGLYAYSVTTWQTNIRRIT